MSEDWAARRRELAEWLAVVRAWGEGVVAVWRARGAELAACHVGPRLTVAEVVGPRPTETSGGAADPTVELMIRLGWLGPGLVSPRWTRRWLDEDSEETVADEVLTVCRIVHHAAPEELVLHRGPCDRPACVVHADTPPRARTGARLPRR